MTGQQKSAQTILSRNMITGQMEEVRFAGSPLEVYNRRVEMETRSAAGEHVEVSVPCSGCVSCCYHKEVDIYPEEERPEDLRHLDVVEDQNGKLVLRKRSDGACVHLAEGGCSVFTHRPRACRMYDCRVHAIAGLASQFDAEHTPPAWAFKTRSESDAIFRQIMLRNGAGYLRAHPECSIEDAWAHAVSKLQKIDSAFSVSPAAGRLALDEALGSR